MITPLERQVHEMKDKEVNVSYKKLWHLLLDLNLKKLQFAEKAKISGATLAKLGADKMVALDVVGKICLTLQCTPNDILEFIVCEDAKSEQ